MSNHTKEEWRLFALAAFELTAWRTRRQHHRPEDVLCHAETRALATWSQEISWPENAWEMDPTRMLTYTQWLSLVWSKFGDRFGARKPVPLPRAKIQSTAIEAIDALKGAVRALMPRSDAELVDEMCEEENAEVELIRLLSTDAEPAKLASAVPKLRELFDDYRSAQLAQSSMATERATAKRANEAIDRKNAIRLAAWSRMFELTERLNQQARTFFMHVTDMCGGGRKL